MAFKELYRSGELTRDIGASVWRAWTGFAIGAVAGIAAGLTTGRVRWADQVFSPIIHMLRSLPPVAIIPLIIIWFGIGDGAKVFSIALAVSFVTWIGAHVGAREVPVTFLWSARSLHTGRAAMLWRVVLPSAATYILSACRTAISLAFVMVYVSELGGSDRGLGFQISVSHLAYRVDRMIAALIVLGFCGAMSDLLLTRSLFTVFPWLKLSMNK
jgi:ABC-type nitrate/sulfonate/bicarbonate transport system permease component